MPKENDTKIELGEYLLENFPKWSAQQRLDWLELFRDTFYAGPSKEDPMFTQAEMDKLNFQLREAEIMAEYENRVIDSRGVMLSLLEKSEQQTADFRKKVQLQKERHDLLLGEAKKPARGLGN